MEMTKRGKKERRIDWRKNNRVQGLNNRDGIQLGHKAVCRFFSLLASKAENIGLS